MGLPGPPSLNLRPRAPTSLQKSLRQFLMGHGFAARVLRHDTGMIPGRPGALAGNPSLPKRPKPRPDGTPSDGTPSDGPRPTWGEGAPGSAWGRAGSPAPRNARPAPRKPPTPTQPRPTWGTKRREGRIGTGAGAIDAGGRNKEARRRTEGAKRRRRPLIPQEKLVCARPQGSCPPARAVPSHLSRPPRRGSGWPRAVPGTLDGGSHCPPEPLSPPPFPRPARRLPQEIPPLPPPSRRIGSGGTVPAAQSGCQSAPAAPPLPAPGPTPISPAERRSWRVSACAQVQRRLLGGERSCP